LALEDKLMSGKTEKQKAGFRTLVNIMNEEKRARAIEIVSNSYSAAMKAWGALAGIPFIGPALGAAAAGTIIAAGASYAAASLAGRALGGQVRSGESYVVGERGPEVLTMGTNGRVIPNDKLGSVSTQPVSKVANVTFQITTVDSRGFDQLLQSRRGQIVSLINDALNDRGRTAIV
jgi:SLT domain-containing protein